MPLLQLLNREQAILEFNRRVLAQAQRDDVPLLERLRYICIVSSNLDEFFEVRFADLLEAVSTGKDGVTHRDVERVAIAAHALIDEQYGIFNEAVMPALAAQGIVILNHADRNEAQRRWVGRFFEREVRPLLMPVSLDPAHPFPQVANKSLHFIVRLSGKDALGRDTRIAIVKVPRVLPRVIKLPPQVSDGRQAFVLLTSVIRAHLEEMFPGRRVEAFSQFRVTRDSDLDVDEDEVTNLRHALRSGLTTRHFGRALRLEVVRTCPAELSEFLLEQYDMPAAALYRVNGPVNLVRLNELIDQTDAPQLRFAPHEPLWPERRLPRGKSILERLRKTDVLLHHPFESFDPVVQMLREAVEDPDVLAIKQTIYRTGAKSVLMDLLIEAARRGKEVMAVVELKARFDEEQNLLWASALERAGVQVVYGFIDWKTHAKISMVIRREGETFRTYCHFGTGNYHPITARIYTDLSFFTADPRIGRDAASVFNYITGYVEPGALELLTMSPRDLRPKLCELIDDEIAHARAGRPASIWAKMNSLVDPALIEKLYQASNAGVQIDLIVRGICCLRPGVAGMSENIRVKSVVGRFLEHSRIAVFGNGKKLPHNGAKVFISSADWMPRNFDRRVEYMLPITNPTVHDQVLDQVMVANLIDTEQSWELGPDGRYTRLEPGEKPFNLHRYFMTNPSLSGRGAAQEHGGSAPKLSLRYRV